MSSLTPEQLERLKNLKAEDIAVPTKKCRSCGETKSVSLFRGNICVTCFEEKINDTKEPVKKLTKMSSTQRQRAVRVEDEKKERKEQEQEQKRIDEAALEETRAFNKKEAAKAELAKRELARRRLLPFVQRFNPEYLPGWVHVDIANRLEKFSQDVADKKSPRLMLFCPPRSGKSELASKTFPAWHLGKYPNHEIISSSYSADLAIDFSRKVRGILNDQDYRSVFKTRLDPKSQSAERWNTTESGGFVASGVGGAITGRGAHCIWSACRVTTHRGIIPIIDVKVGDKVWGYDHNTETECWTEVRAVSTQYKPELTQTGKVWSTPEHRFFVEDRGYVQARRLQRNVSGSKVCSLLNRVWEVFQGNKTQPYRKTLLYAEMRPWGQRNRREDNVCLREQKSSTCEHMSEMLCGRKRKSVGETGMLPLQDSLFTPERGARKVCKASWTGYIKFLLQRLLQRAQAVTGTITRSSRFKMSDLLYTPFKMASESGTEVLLPRLLPNVPQTEPRSRIHRLFGRVDADQNTKTGKRQTHVSNVLESKCFGSSSYRPRCKQPEPQKSDNSVSGVPLAVSQQRGVSARDIKSNVQGSGFCVVDLQTTTENFFCEGILAHNCAIVDDPIKNREEAESATTRQKIKDWYTSTFYTRLAPGGGVLVILTRWHDDDLAGWLLEQEKKGGDKWDVVRYPAIAVEDEKYRKKGEALHPDRYPIEALERIKRAVGDRDWSALYQQNPVPDEGAYFQKDWFRYYDAPPPRDEMRIYQAWDFAIGTKEHNDYTVGATIGIGKDDRAYVLNIERGKWDALEIVETIIDQYEAFRPQLVGMEKGQIEMALGPMLKKRMRERNVYFTTEELKTGRRDKSARARPLQGRMQQGMVLFPERADFTNEARNEMLRFPAGAHDDIVDSLAWVFQLLQSFTVVPDNPPPKKKSWRDNLNKYVKYGNKYRGRTHMRA